MHVTACGLAACWVCVRVVSLQRLGPTRRYVRPLCLVLLVLLHFPGGRADAVSWISWRAGLQPPGWLLDQVLRE